MQGIIGTDLFQLFVKLDRTEFRVVAGGDEKFSDVQAEVAFGDVTVAEFRVAPARGEIEKPLHVVIDQEFQDRSVLKIDPFL